jgi:hypothetical protein
MMFSNILPQICGANLISILLESIQFSFKYLMKNSMCIKVERIVCHTEIQQKFVKISQKFAEVKYFTSFH